MARILDVARTAIRYLKVIADAASAEILTGWAWRVQRGRTTGLFYRFVALIARHFRRHATLSGLGSFCFN
jgi:hypothetical protein